MEVPMVLKGMLAVLASVTAAAIILSPFIVIFASAVLAE